MAYANAAPNGGEPLLSTESQLRLPPVEAVPVDQKDTKGRVGWLAAGGLALVMGVVGVGEKMGIVPKGTMGKGFDTVVNFIGTTTVEQQVNGLYAEGRGDQFERDLDLVFHHRVGTLMSDWGDYFSDFPSWCDYDVASWPAAQKEQFSKLDQNHKDQITWIISARKALESMKSDRQTMISAALKYLEAHPPRNWASQSSENRVGTAKDAMMTVVDERLPKQGWRFSAVPRKTPVLTADVNLTQK